MHKSYGICPQTIEFFCDTTGQLTCPDPNIVANRTRYMIRDLCLDSELRQRPYVTGWPYMRSYLEVPVTSPSGYIIGGFSVVDNRCRDYEEKDVQALTDIARAVTSHLEHVRTNNQQSRSVQLIKGLSEFLRVEAGYETPKTNLAMHARRAYVPPSTPDPGEQERSAWPLAGRIRQTATRSAAEATDRSISAAATESSGFPSEVREAFSRSASLIQSCLAMDGVAFLDASSISSFSHQRFCSFGYDPLPTNDLILRDIATAKPCLLLAFSVSDTYSSASATEPIAIPQTLLERLMRYSPRTSIFSRDEFGIMEGSNTAQLHEASLDSSDDDHMVEQRRRDLKALFVHLPRATSVILFPMWHFQKDRWYAVGICWTCDPLYHFDSRDGSYISAFGNSIMAEILRFEALAVSKTKSDFISSISHEIRSPLHGILATTELLGDTLHSIEQRSMLTMIRSCGTTLLDTLNHLLDFAKINKLTVSKRLQYKPDSVALKSVNLDHLVEEVTETVGAGFAFELKQYMQGPAPQHGPHITPSRDGESDGSIPILVTLDIQLGVNWKMPLDTGAWKRIVLNLVGNALKYTPKGHINVKLAIKDHNIAFCVEDTGIGISEEYLKHKLFTPFAQENPFSSGTGLGLSIVHQMVKDLGGQLEIESELGRGTIASVTVPLPSCLSPQPSNREHSFRPGLVGRKFCMVKHQEWLESNQSSDHLTYMQRLEAYVARIAESRLGMHATSAEPADVFIIDGSLQTAPDLCVPPFLLGKPVLVITEPRSWHRLLKRGFGYIRMPFGPRQLADGIIQAIDSASPTEIANGTFPDEAVKSDRTPAATQQEYTHEKTITSSTPNASPSEDVAQLNITPKPAIAVTKDESKCAHNILVVDDNVVNVKILTKLLGVLGCAYITAFNGAQAVEAYKATCAPADPANASKNPVRDSTLTMVFMDMNMPVMDGFEATNAIREYELACGIKPVVIIALTGLGDEANQKQAFSSGVNDFWTKPVKLAKVKKLLVLTDEARA